MPIRLLATTPEANLARLPIALDLRAISLAEGAACRDVDRRHRGDVRLAACAGLAGGSARLAC